MPYQHLGDARVLTLIAPEGGVTAGLPYLYEDTVVIATATRAGGVQYEGLIRGHVVVPKTVAQAWAIGDAIAFDSATALFNNIGTGIACGIAATVAINPSTTGQIVLGGGSSGNGSGGLPAGLTFVSPCLTVGTDTDNQVEVCGSTPGNPVTVGVTGMATTVDLRLAGKGTASLVQFFDLGAYISRNSILNLVGDTARINIDPTGPSGATTIASTGSLGLDSNGGSSAHITMWSNITAPGLGGSIWFQGENEPFSPSLEIPSLGGVNIINGLIADTVTVTTRTGTPAAMAAFDSGGKLVEVTGASGTFTTVDLKTVTVLNGIITSIVP